MSIWAIIYLILSALSLGIALAKDGEPQSNYSFLATLLGTSIGLWILYMGGFFT